MAHIIFAITNDIPFDQRMKKICTSLSGAGFEVTLVGRAKKTEVALPQATYHQKRIYCFFTKGKLFYIEFNIRLFFFLLFARNYTVISAVDTDTLLACWAAAKIKRKKFVFDAHEYFTQMEEVIHRPITKKIWTWVENICIPSVHAAYTISQGYADLFEKRFHQHFSIVRNATVLKDKEVLTSQERKFILYQGSVNVGRGLEELIEAMPLIDFPLVICGEGDLYLPLQQKVKELQLQDKVSFTGYLTPEVLLTYTYQAKIGITLFSNDGLSNHHSLCNRFFDYMHAGVPQICTNYPEYEEFNKEFKVSVLIDTITPAQIATVINQLLAKEHEYNFMLEECLKARKTNTWQQEESKLINIYKEVISLS